MSLLQTHREASPSSEPRACLTARPLLERFLHRVGAYSVLWRCWFLRPNLVFAYALSSRTLAARQQARRTLAPRPQQTIEHP